MEQNANDEALRIKRDIARSDAEIVSRQTEREQIASKERQVMAEERTHRIVAFGIALCICVFLLSVTYLWAHSMDIPDATKLQGGTVIDCVVQGDE